MKSKALLLAGLIIAASSAHATTFDEENGFGTPDNFSSCKSVVNTTDFATGTVLVGSYVEDECFGYFNVSIDTSAKTIILTGAQTGNYEAGMLSITGITGETITGLSTISSAGLFDTTFYSDALAIPSPVLSFTGDSINISFNVAGNPSPFGQFAYSGSGGQAIFSYSSVTAAVPEPASWAMMIGGVGFAGGAMRRRRRVANSKIAFA